jgi:hypothetical protein
MPRLWRNETDWWRGWSVPSFGRTGLRRICGDWSVALVSWFMTLINVFFLFFFFAEAGVVAKGERDVCVILPWGITVGALLT